MKRIDSLVRALLVGVGVLLLAGFAVPSVSQADTLSFDLTSNHCGNPDACGAPGTIFGTVTLTGSNTPSTPTTITVHLNNPPYVYAQTGSADFLLFKFNATGVVLGDISVSQTISGQTLAAVTGAFNGDGTGAFTFGIQCTTCGNGIQTFSNDLVFTVANATFADLTASNGTAVFVADIGNSTNGATGPIDATTPNVPTPEPSTMVLYGLGLSMLLVGQKWRKARGNQSLL